MLSRWLKTFVVGVFVLGASLALALPTPKDIESAVAAGHYTQAESMLREVLQDKPQSAKAHYELGQVLARVHRYKEAQTELLKAKDIDPTLKFAISPERFNTVLSKVNDLAAAPTSSVVMEPSIAPAMAAATQAAPEAPSSSVGSPLTFVWLAIAGLAVFGLWLRRSAAVKTNSSPVVAPVTSPIGTAAVSRGFGAQFTPNAAPVGNVPQGYPTQGYAQPNSGVSNMTGVMVGGLAGVAAGYALSKALEGDHPAAPSAAAGATPAPNNGGYVPFDTPAQPDFGAFDAGSGSDWDGADSGGSDDSW